MKTRFRTRRSARTPAAWLLLVVPVILVAGSLLTAVQTVEGGWSGGYSGATAARTRTTTSAEFIQWGSVTTGMGPCLTMTVLPMGKGKKPVTITVPNADTKKKARTIDPPAAVKTLAGQVKVGDTVNIVYESTRTTCTLCSASASGNLSDNKDKPFTFIAVRRTRHAGKSYMAVCAAKGSMTWNFLIPNGDSGPDAELLKKTKTLRRGDQIKLTYEPFQYTFQLKDVEVVPKAAE